MFVAIKDREQTGLRASNIKGSAASAMSFSTQSEAEIRAAMDGLAKGTAGAKELLQQMNAMIADRTVSMEDDMQAMNAAMKNMSLVTRNETTGKMQSGTNLTGLNMSALVGNLSPEMATTIHQMLLNQVA